MLKHLRKQVIRHIPGGTCLSACLDLLNHVPVRHAPKYVIKLSDKYLGTCKSACLKTGVLNLNAPSGSLCNACRRRVNQSGLLRKACRHGVTQCGLLRKACRHGVSCYARPEGTV